MDNAIVFHGTVYKVQTLSDGGLRITFDLPESAIAQAAMLMECKRESIPLIIEAREDTDILTKLYNETKTEPEKRTSRVGRRRA